MHLRLPDRWPGASAAMRALAARGRRPKPFSLVLAFYQRDPAYSLGLASISAYAKREIQNVRVSLVPILRGDDAERVARIVADLQPDLLGVAAMSPTWLPSDPYLQAFKRALPDVPVLVGGYQAIVSPEETIAHQAVDFVCVGDGEAPVAALIRRLAGETSVSEPITGLWEKRGDGTVVRGAPFLVQDLRELPFPDYSLFERDGDIHYLSPRAIQSPTLITLPVLSGRGCPYRCTYCANTTLLDLFGGKNGLLRKHDPEALTRELARLRDRHGVQFFQFWDEEFVYDARYTKTLFSSYRERVGLPFSMFARVESMSDEFCAAARAAGCHSMWFGVESGSEEYRRRYLNRRMATERIIEAATTAQKHGIKRFAFAMVGMPFESRSDVDATLALMRAIRPELSVFSQYVPLPGTPLYELCRQHDLLLPAAADQQMWPLGALNIRQHPGALTPAEMQEVAAEIMTYLDVTNRFDA